MKYRQIQPSDILKPYIRFFGLLEDDGLYSQIKTFKIIADGCPGMIFQENPNFFLSKDRNKLPQLFLHGLTTSISQKTAKGNYRNIGIYFQPNAIKSIFGIDASELTDSYINLNDLIKNDLTEQLLTENKTDKRIEILSNFIYGQIEKNKHLENQKTAYAISKINTKNDDSLCKIQSALNISERSLERIFKTDIGISPKLFFRICRFQAALDSVRAQAFNSLTEIAYQHSYADQSHFIREFNEFTGVRPKQFLEHANEQALNFPEWKS